jgi:hypothetical protein
VTDDNLPARQDDARPAELVQRDQRDLRAATPATARMLGRTRRPLPENAYVRPGLGDLPLSYQLRTALSLIAETLVPLVDGIEAKQPEVVQCSVCRRNLGGWPQQVLDDHYWQHTWLQRRLAAIGIH